MSYDNYMLMYYIALAVCIVFFLITILLFFVLKIPKAFGDITGRTAKKAIQSINEENERAKAQRETERMGAMETDRITPSGKLVKDSIGNTVVTETIGTEQLGETTVLGSSAGETSVLSSNAGETTLLENSFETENLSKETEQLVEEEKKLEKGFVREVQNITFIHTTEFI